MTSTLYRPTPQLILKPGVPAFVLPETPSTFNWCAERPEAADDATETPAEAVPSTPTDTPVAEAPAPAPAAPPAAAAAAAAAPAAASPPSPAADAPTKAPPAADAPTPAAADAPAAAPVAVRKRTVPVPDAEWKPAANVVFIGHVDAGKSTIAGQILWLTGGVDERTMDKYTVEAAKINRESWRFAWTMDLTQEERDKGKTHETGAASFVTDSRRYTILDAPGHKAFVPEMIGGAAQADIAVLVISARRGEFETGFERGGQTREHAILTKQAGVRFLVIAVNKMDDLSVEWSKERYDEILTKLTRFLGGIGWTPANRCFVPISGLSGTNIRHRMPEDCPCKWYSGPSLFEALDTVSLPARSPEDSCRFPVFGKYKDMGNTFVHGKCEAGAIGKGNSLLLIPPPRGVTTMVEIVSLNDEGKDADAVFPGEFMHLQVRGVEESDIKVGSVLCEPSAPLKVVWHFAATILILECKTIVASGYESVMHCHAITEECFIAKIVALVDKQTGEVKERNPPFVKPGSKIVARVQMKHNPVAVESFTVNDRLARFMLRTDGATVAVGVVDKLFETPPPTS